MSPPDRGGSDSGRAPERTRLARSRTSLSVLVALLSTVHVAGAVQRHRGLWLAVVAGALVAMLAASRPASVADRRRDGRAPLVSVLALAVLLVVVAVS